MVSSIGLTSLMAASISIRGYASKDRVFYENYENSNAQDEQKLKDQPLLAYLLSKGANPNAVVPHLGWTALSFAISGANYCSLNTIKTLIHAPGLNIHHTHGSGVSYLLQAVDSGQWTPFRTEESKEQERKDYLVICKMLLDRGVDPNRHSGNELGVLRSPLAAARSFYYTSNEPLIELLIKYGAVDKIELKNKAKELYDQRLANGEDSKKLRAEKWDAIYTYGREARTVLTSIQEAVSAVGRSSEYISRMVHLKPTSIFNDVRS